MSRTALTARFMRTVYRKNVLRGSLAETVGETLGVTGVTGTEVVKRNIIFTLVLTAAIVVFLVAGSSLKFLMI